LPDELARVAAYPLTPTLMACGAEPAANQEIDHRPHGTAPVAHRVESGVVRIEAGQKVLYAACDTLEVL
jgi:hypothetical protein